MVEVYPALNGDCFLVHTKAGLILIDCGYSSTYTNYLKPRLIELAKAGLHILRFIVTHIDEDHIHGALKFIEENGSSSNPSIIKIDQIWHNTYRHFISVPSEESSDLSNETIESIFKAAENKSEKQISARQGSSLGALILRNGYNWNSDFSNAAVSLDNKQVIQLTEDIVITLLSPDNNSLQKLEKFWKRELFKLGFRDKIASNKLFDDAYEFLLMYEKQKFKKTDEHKISSSDFDVPKLMNSEFEEDNSATNGSSIAFILQIQNKKLLFLGDALPTLTVKSILDIYPKSPKPIWFEFIKLSHHGNFGNNSPDFFKTTDSNNYCISTNGDKYGHPSSETIAWIIGRNNGVNRNLYFNYANAAYNVLNNDEIKKKWRYTLHLIPETKLSIDL